MFCERGQGTCSGVVFPSGHAATELTRGGGQLRRFAGNGYTAHLGRSVPAQVASGPCQAALRGEITRLLGMKYLPVFTRSRLRPYCFCSQSRIVWVGQRSLAFVIRARVARSYDIPVAKLFKIFSMRFHGRVSMRPLTLREIPSLVQRRTVLRLSPHCLPIYRCDRALAHIFHHRRVASPAPLTVIMLKLPSAWKRYEGFVLCCACSGTVSRLY